MPGKSFNYKILSPGYKTGVYYFSYRILDLRCPTSHHLFNFPLFNAMASYYPTLSGYWNCSHPQDMETVEKLSTSLIIYKKVYKTAFLCAMFISEVHQFWIYDLHWWLWLSGIHSWDFPTIPLTLLLPQLLNSFLALSCGFDDISLGLWLGSHFAFCAIFSSSVSSLTWLLVMVCAQNVNLLSYMCASKLNNSMAAASVSTNSYQYYSSLLFTKIG